MEDVGKFKVCKSGGVDVASRVEREPPDGFKPVDFDAVIERARVANVARGMLEGRTQRDESEAKDALS